MSIAAGISENRNALLSKLELAWSPFVWPLARVVVADGIVKSPQAAQICPKAPYEECRIAQETIWCRFQTRASTLSETIVDEWVSLRRKLSTSLTEVHFTRPNELLRSTPRPATRDQHCVERGCEDPIARSLIDSDHYFIFSTKVTSYLGVPAGTYRSMSGVVPRTSTQRALFVAQGLLK